MAIPVPRAFAIIARVGDSVAVLDLVGEHDMSTANDVATAIREQASLDRGVVVSLVETDYIDSSILRVLFQADRMMLSKGRRLVLLTGGRTASIETVLELTQVRERLLCCDTIEEAVEFAEQVSD
jgi:anti-anti-sigma factor